MALATFHWMGTFNQDYWNFNNWREGAVPPNDGTADISFLFSGMGQYPKSTAQDINIRSLNMTSINPSLTLDRSALTLQNGGQFSDGFIRMQDGTGGDDVRDITLAGGAFTWTGGVINPGPSLIPQFHVQPGATLHIATGTGGADPGLKLGTKLINNGGTINIVGSPGGTFTFGNGRGLNNISGVVTISYSVGLARQLGSAPNFDNAYIHNYSGATITWRDGTISSDLPVSNAGTFQVMAQTQAAAVTIRNASPNTDNVGMEQHYGLTLIDANVANATLSVDEGYKAIQGTLRGKAGGMGLTPTLMSVYGDIRLTGTAGSAVALDVGSAANVNTVFVMSAPQVIFGDRFGATWWWQNGSYSKLDVQGNLTITGDYTIAILVTVAGRPNEGDQATVLTCTGSLSGGFAIMGGDIEEDGT